MQSQFNAITDEIRAAEKLLAEIQNEQQKIIAAGMLAAIPRIEWQSRNGDADAKYMYLVFNQDNQGRYPTPGNKRKMYIGADPNKQNHAAIKIDRRQRWERLDRKAAELKRWISRKEAELESIRRELAAIHADRESWQKYQITEKDKISQ